MMNRELCIVIASHISNPRRIEYLKECLLSLANQTYPAVIYISISFENNDLLNQFVQLITEIHFPKTPVIKIQEKKTPQMRHMYLLLNEIEKNGHKWIMFCDDDDTYQINRVEIFAKTIHQGLLECSVITGKMLAGIYESTFGKFHHEHRHEYWCYCVSYSTFYRFFNVISKYDDVLDNKCCDIIFAEYLRRSGENFAFGRITDPLYNYRIEDNGDSITGSIKYQQTQIRVPNPPSLSDETALKPYVFELDKYIKENIDIYKHDTYLRAVVGIQFDDIMQKEFKADYGLLPYVDQTPLIEILKYWQRLRNICNELYDIKI